MILQHTPTPYPPRKATSGSACWDLASPCRGTVHPGSQRTFDLGYSVAVPEGYALMIYSRSGHGVNAGVTLANCVGVIDSDYRGNLMVTLRAAEDGPGLVVRPGDRIAQAMLTPVPQATLECVDTLPPTERGAGGHGSTGA